eukprot:CAMPEP_0202918936 /NCGR_PEP_ID=MMETSP1392-20130828/74573_1 /ASSEMBLY_ACC=CAM_ASM_000868 /TAXON_ID=225041 /ORGANISM="Chlamydomonas chlamydogama, Strain SAG 11-48b" /LENGTH=53 /DNA_ID=CAMNT_0049612119 /DNA_START=115 /DNA_END=272 /DNA_ORIENTATION=+
MTFSASIHQPTPGGKLQQRMEACLQQGAIIAPQSLATESGLLEEATTNPSSVT